MRLCLADRRDQPPASMPLVVWVSSGSFSPAQPNEPIITRAKRKAKSARGRPGRWAVEPLPGEDCTKHLAPPLRRSSPVFRAQPPFVQIPISLGSISPPPLPGRGGGVPSIYLEWASLASAGGKRTSSRFETTARVNMMASAAVTPGRAGTAPPSGPAIRAEPGNVTPGSVPSMSMPCMASAPVSGSD